MTDLPLNIDLAIRIVEAFSRRELGEAERILYDLAVGVLREHLKGSK